MAIFARLIEFARHHLQSRKTIAAVSTLIIVLAIPLTVYIAGQQQDLRQRASENILTITGVAQTTTVDNGVDGCNVNFSIATNFTNSQRSMSIYYQGGNNEEWLGGARTDQYGYLYAHRKYPYSTAPQQHHTIFFKVGNETDGWAEYRVSRIDVSCIPATPAPMTCVIDDLTLHIPETRTVKVKFHTNRAPNMTTEKPVVNWHRDQPTRFNNTIWSSGTSTTYETLFSYPEDGTYYVTASVDVNGNSICTNPVAERQKPVTVALPTATSVPPTATATPIPPTATATSVPPTATGTVTATATSTGIVSPTATGAPSSATLNFTLNLGTLGGPTRQIKTQQRNISVEFFSGTDTKVGSTITQANALQYNSGTGKFTGSVAVSGIPAGSYSVKIKTDRYLKKRLPQLVTLTGTTQQIPLVFDEPLVIGNIIGDDILDIQDYNALVGCFGPKADTSSCTNKVNADLNDDGTIDEFDYNLLWRNFSVRRGD